MSLVPLVPNRRKTMKTSLFFLITFWLEMMSCSAGVHNFTLKISGVADQRIPISYACDGENNSPAIFWSEEPQETKSYVLIVADRDAFHEGSSTNGNFIHW